jgi:hypothetical protein
MTKFAREYYVSEVLKMLHDSNHRPSPFNGQPGHALSKHSGIDNTQLQDRLGGVAASAGETPVKKASAFKHFTKGAGGQATNSSDMAFMVCFVLNSTTGQAALAELDAGKRRVSIVESPPTRILGSEQLGNIKIRQHERIGSVNAFKNAPRAAGASHYERSIDIGSQNIWILVDRGPDYLHIHTASPSDPTDPQRPIGSTSQA